MLTKLLLIGLLVIAFFLRTYRLDDLLGFYYDQGRDAVEIWELWHQGDFFLIGPTTGIEGIFLGPFYYYFIAPWYLLGGGNPVVPAIWLAVVNVGAIYVFYRLGRDFINHRAGFLVAILMTFSLDQVQSHRWLSNPTPLPLFAALALYSLLRIIHRTTNTLWWAILGLSLGLSLQLEAASAIFFLPATLFIFLINHKTISWSFQKLVVAAVLFGSTFLPQIVFDFRNDHLLYKAFQTFLISDRSFQGSFVSFAQDRLLFYFQSFYRLFFHEAATTTLIVVGMITLTFLCVWSLPRKAFFALVIWWLTPLVLLLFYHGNNGYVWGYYFTGIYPVFILLIAAILSRSNLAIIGIFVGLFLWQNIPRIKSYLTAGTDGPTHITLGPSLEAVDWVYEHAGTTPFNVDVYVPPVIPHAYTYLFLWRGATKYHTQPQTDQVERLYTVFEQDPPHPERLEAWLTRQAGYAIVDESARFGGITSEARTRFP